MAGPDASGPLPSPRRHRANAKEDNQVSGWGCNRYTMYEGFVRETTITCSSTNDRRYAWVRISRHLWVATKRHVLQNEHLPQRKRKDVSTRAKWQNGCEHPHCSFSSKVRPFRTLGSCPESSLQIWRTHLFRRRFSQSRPVFFSRKMKLRFRWYAE